MVWVMTRVDYYFLLGQDLFDACWTFLASELVAAAGTGAEAAGAIVVADRVAAGGEGLYDYYLASWRVTLRPELEETSHRSEILVGLMDRQKLSRARSLAYPPDYRAPPFCTSRA